MAAGGANSRRKGAGGGDGREVEGGDGARGQRLLARRAAAVASRR